MYKHLLLPTDGSDLASKGVRHGLELARQLGAAVTLIVVTESMPYAELTAVQPRVNPFARYDAEMEAFFNAVKAPIEKQANELGVALDTIHEPHAIPGEAIVRVAERVGADLIVMASHGRRGLSKMLLGSQTTEVLTHTKIPVLVVR